MRLQFSPQGQKNKQNQIIKGKNMKGKLEEKVEREGSYKGEEKGGEGKAGRQEDCA